MAQNLTDFISLSKAPGFRESAITDKELEQGIGNNDYDDVAKILFDKWADCYITFDRMKDCRGNE